MYMFLISNGVQQNIGDRSGTPWIRPGGVTQSVQAVAHRLALFSRETSGTARFITSPQARPLGLPARYVACYLRTKFSNPHVPQTGGIYRTTYGPDFYQSFRNFPGDTKFVIPLNFGNNTLEIALDQANAAAKYVPHGKVLAFECASPYLRGAFLQ